MRHPFELEISELEAVNLNTLENVSEQEIKQVTGGGGSFPIKLPDGSFVTRAMWEVGGFPRPPFQPPTATTLALGEEGGCFFR